MVYIRKLSERNIFILCLIWIVTFFIILVIFYTNKNDGNEKFVVAENAKEEILNNNLNIGMYNKELLKSVYPYDETTECLKSLIPLIYNGMFEYDSEENLIPKLITEYAMVNDRSYVFKLKDNTYFQNGKKLITKDIKDTIEKIYLNENSEYYGFVKNIQNVKIIDDNFFKINLIAPENQFEKNLIFPIVCEELNIGTGKYKIEEILENEIKLIETEEKTGQKLNIYIYTMLKDLYKDFKNKELDIISINDNADYKEYIGQFGYEEKIYKGNKYMFLEVNFNDKKLENDYKELILSVINTTEIIEKIYTGNAFQNNLNKFNLDKGVDILESLNYEYKNNNWYRNGEILKIKILLNKKELTKLEIANIIKLQMEKIGLFVEIDEAEEKEYNMKIKDKEYNLIIKDKNSKELENIEKDEFFICNKLSLLYSLNMSGNINPTVDNIFNNIMTWKKVITN